MTCNLAGQVCIDTIILVYKNVTIGYMSIIYDVTIVNSRKRATYIHED